ncbi:ROK family protein [Consotaella salsifontis]|uniref:Sugar kinase of the NBD/HSP70 family, may contain an N-terminal HTH domain n=1 Tax=Consotaella salsifontis TaxID=1365950 RepID=A0A1T4R896_9HYPH|nr:ROK family transcriptional regulator [Consotaella salsifontis]SKA12036.1 Sugar kinase of the NBD/HSP70 family, may contain an N-terminal HTH domain [Consotaella salsifontis]
MSHASAGLGQGSNSGQVRRFNERVILAALRRMGEASKADLARIASLTNNAAGVIVQELEKAGLVSTLGKRRGGRGQPPTMLSLNPDGAYAIGIRLDRATIKTVLVDFTGAPIAQHVHTLDLPSPAETMGLLIADIGELLDHLPGRRERLVGIGLATPYDLGAWLDRLSLPAPSFKQWEGFDIGTALGEATNLDVVVENDGTAGTIAELFYGHGRKLDDFLYVFIGPAIGGGVVSQGAYLRGAHGNAGDIGMMPVRPSSLPSAPPTDKTWDILLSRASVSSLVRHLRWSGHVVTGLDDLAEAASVAPAAVEEWIVDGCEALTPALLAACSVLDTTAAVVDGDLPLDITKRLVDRLEARMAAEAAELRPPPKLLLGRLGQDASAIGAATLPLHLNFSPHADILTRRGNRNWPGFDERPSHFDAAAGDFANE